MNNITEQFSKEACIYNWQVNNTLRRLVKLGFDNVQYAVKNGTQEFANGEDEVYEWVAITGRHAESGVAINLELKFIANDGERYDYENDPDCENPLEFDYTDKNEYFLSDVFVNGVKYYNYNECDCGHANYQLDDDFDQWISNRYKNGINRWVEYGGSFRKPQ